MRLRSILFVPGDRPERVAKAAASGADAIICDLEDSVAPTAKAGARDAIAAILEAPPAGTPIFVRVNPVDTRACALDLPVAAKAHAIVLPKAEGAKSVRALDAMRSVLPPILPIATETPGAIFELGSFRAVADRLIGLSWGAEDLPAAIGASASRNADGNYLAPYELARSLTLFAAHAAGVQAIDTVYPAIRDLNGLTAYAQRAARDGFTGMLAVHPDHIASINAAFTPSAAELDHARAIIAAFASNPGAGVMMFEGKMIDAPHLHQARKVVARADEQA